jgi:hypothetical protein
LRLCYILLHCSLTLRSKVWCFPVQTKRSNMYPVAQSHITERFIPESTLQENQTLMNRYLQKGWIHHWSLS